MPIDVSTGTIHPRGLNLDKTQFDMVPVREFANLCYGKALQEGIRCQGIVPVYGTNGRCGWHDRALAQPPGIILGRKGQGHLGVEWCLQPFWVIDTAYYAQIDSNRIDPRWFYYITSYIGLDHLKSGEKPGLNRDVFLSQAFPLPKIQIQRAISQVLGVLDDKIELNRKMNKTLEDLAAAIFKSWFVDFDPVIAKAEGRKPFGMNAETAALFPDSFEDSELGLIPKGWRISEIGKEVNVVGGSTPSTKEPSYWDGNINWLTPRDLSKIDDPIVIRTERRITEAGLQQVSSGLLPIGTVLMSSRAPIGYIAIADVPVAINQGFIGLRCEKVIPSCFVWCWVKENMDEILSRAGGTTFSEISKAAFRPIPVLVPSHTVLDVYSQIAEPLIEKIAANVRETICLTQLRDLLLPKLLSGEIRVKDAEKVVSEAV